MQTSVDEGLCLLIIVSPPIPSRICSDVKVGHDDDDQGVRGRLQGFTPVTSLQEGYFVCLTYSCSSW